MSCLGTPAKGPLPVPPKTPEGSTVTGNVPIPYPGQEQSRQLGTFPSPLEMVGEGGERLDEGKPGQWACNNDKDNNSIKG